jgi:nucleoid DNA-binding protein
MKGVTMAKRKTAKASTGKKALTKSQVIATLAESNECSKKEVASLFEELATLIGKNLGKRGPGVFTIPGMAKIKVVRKPATKARKGINPFTGEETTFKAKPARNVVKITALKALKDMV